MRHRVRRAGDELHLHVGKATVEVVAHHRVAIVGQQVVGEGLALNRAQLIAQQIVRKVTVAGDLHRPDQRLRALLDIDGNAQMALLAFVIIVHMGGDFHLLKSICLVEASDDGEITRH